MKKMLIIMMVMGLTVILALPSPAEPESHSNAEIGSMNIAGYQCITCPRGKSVLAATAFESIGGKDMKSADVFGDQLPIGSVVFAYDPSTRTYIRDSRTAGGWSTNITFKHGMGFWITVPGDAPEESYEVATMGEVSMAETTTNLLANGSTLLAFPYTAGVLWTNTALARNACLGDKLMVYNPVTGYRSYTYSSRAGWSDADKLLITLDMGFWYHTSGASRTNVEVRPYESFMPEIPARIQHRGSEELEHRRRLEKLQTLK